MTKLIYTAVRIIPFMLVLLFFTQMTATRMAIATTSTMMMNTAARPPPTKATIPPPPEASEAPVCEYNELIIIIVKIAVYRQVLILFTLLSCFCIRDSLEFTGGPIEPRGTGTLKCVRRVAACSTIETRAGTTHVHVNLTISTLSMQIYILMYSIQKCLHVIHQTLLGRCTGSRYLRLYK